MPSSAMIPLRLSLQETDGENRNLVQAAAGVGDDVEPRTD
jgi:hypothetical protein